MGESQHCRDDPQVRCEDVGRHPDQRACNERRKGCGERSDHDSDQDGKRAEQNAHDEGERSERRDAETAEIVRELAPHVLGDIGNAGHGELEAWSRVTRYDLVDGAHGGIVILPLEGEDDERGRAVLCQEEARRERPIGEVFEQLLRVELLIFIQLLRAVRERPCLDALDLAQRLRQRAEPEQIVARCDLLGARRDEDLLRTSELAFDLERFLELRIVRGEEEVGLDLGSEIDECEHGESERGADGNRGPLRQRAEKRR